MCLLLLMYFNLHNIKFLKYLDFHKWQGTFFDKFTKKNVILTNFPVILTGLGPQDLDLRSETETLNSETQICKNRSPDLQYC